MRIHNYVHPGEIVKDAFENKGLNVTEAAKKLGLTRTAISRLFNCRTAISPEMAVRLSIAFSTSIEMWINLQIGYDIWLLEKRRKIIAKQVTPISVIKARKSNKSRAA